MYIRESRRSYNGRTYVNYLLVESVQTPKGPRQRTVCSLGDLSPRPREEWLKLACKIEDALIGQGELLEADDGGVAEIVGRVRARRAHSHRNHDVMADRQPARSPGSGGGLIKVDPARVATERHREADSHAHAPTPPDPVTKSAPEPSKQQPDSRSRAQSAQASSDHA
ncbi:MAG: hypothetical protein ACREEU_02595 [Acetobacteraceae bacterium]